MQSVRFNERAAQPFAQSLESFEIYHHHREVSFLLRVSRRVSMVQPPSSAKVSPFRVILETL